MFYTPYIKFLWKIVFFDKSITKFGEHVHVLDWALHLDESTPHIHERHVFDCENRYGEVAPQPSVETAALLSKKALMRPLGSHNENERAAYMEKLLEDGINSIGLGPQGMGGKYSVMGVHIENTARHPSAIGVAVNVGCWSHRRGHIIFDKDLNYTIDTHSGVTL